MDQGLVAGFTGTREGLSSPQREALLNLLIELKPRELHHGDCLGADTEAHLLCVALQILIHIHPPNVGAYRAYCHFLGTDFIEKIWEEKPYLVRNHDIVDNSDYLIACVKGPEELKSGTWATVRYARAGDFFGDIPVYVIYPDGRVDRPPGG
jgi:hypothetical protein